MYVCIGDKNIRILNGTSQNASELGEAKCKVRSDVILGREDTRTIHKCIGECIE